VIVERGGDGLLDPGDVVVGDAVQLFGGDPRFHVRTQHLQYLGRKAAGYTHLFDLFFGLDDDTHDSIVYFGQSRGTPLPDGPLGDAQPSVEGLSCWMSRNLEVSRRLERGEARSCTGHKMSVRRHMYLGAPLE